MKYTALLFILLSTSVQAGLKVENGEVLPFSRPNYPLGELIKDYAELTGQNVTYPSNLFNEKSTVHVQLSSKANKEQFRIIFYNLLDIMGFSPVAEDGFLWIRASRDIRYSTSTVYADNGYPKDSSYSIVVHRLKYPLSSEIARNLRPFISRYGRVIDFSDARTIMIHEKGDNVERLQKSMEFMDTEAAYKKVLAFVPKKDESAGDPLQEKILDLEIQNKLLEKKYLELKEKSMNGVHNL